jgi:hypothetical protein
MTTINTFSLSLQKQIQKNHITFDSEINRAFNELKLKSLLNRSSIVKQRGYTTVSILLLIVLLPFLKRTLADFKSTNYIQNGLDAQKDSYYRFLNNERFNWRRLIYLVALKIIASCEKVPLSQEVLIADDTIAPKTGKNMELVSYHFDYKLVVPYWAISACNWDTITESTFFRSMSRSAHPATVRTAIAGISINEPMGGAGERKPYTRKQMLWFKWLIVPGSPGLMPHLFCSTVGLPMMM